MKFVDYGNYEQVPKNAIKPIPTDIVKNLQCRLDQVPHLAVKYKLKGVKSRIRYSEKPDRYSIGLHLGQIYEVEIFSTFSGEFVKVDVFHRDVKNGRRIFLNDELCKVWIEIEVSVFFFNLFSNLRDKGQISKGSSQINRSFKSLNMAFVIGRKKMLLMFQTGFTGLIDILATQVQTRAWTVLLIQMGPFQTRLLMRRLIKAGYP